MIFETDKQTLTDLNLLGKYKANSVYAQFCRTVTAGGELLLEQMFNEPLTDKEQINQRIAEFQWFKTHGIAFPVTSEQSECAERYLLSKDYGVGAKLVNVLKFRFLEAIGNDPRLELWRKQIETAARFLIEIRNYVEKLDKSIYATPIGKQIKQISQTLNSKAFEPIVRHNWNSKLTMVQVFEFDKIMLTQLHDKLAEMLRTIYRIDVNTTIGEVAREREFCFPTVTDDPSVIIRVRGLRHPCLKAAVPNDLEISHQHNVFFLTGANMAGKSTLMKSFAISVYMAHMGFPVAASEMTFSVQQGLYTSINISDNLNMGYSHFYAEVLRVKNVAIEVSRDKRLVVVFDELFKGTNVKDAYDATLAVTAALAQRKNCALMISTHIIEVATELGQECKNVAFEYLPTVMKGSVPTYTYKLQPGITSDKHGMIILNNECVIDIILGNKLVV